MEQDYSKREIDNHFEEVYHRLDEVKSGLVSLNSKVAIQNGSVGNLKAWRSGLTMVVAVISFIVLPLIVYSFKLSQDNLRQSIILELRK